MKGNRDAVLLLLAVLLSGQAVHWLLTPQPDVGAGGFAGVICQLLGGLVLVAWSARRLRGGDT